jgi:hypothetical protein
MPSIPTVLETTLKVLISATGLTMLGGGFYQLWRLDLVPQIATTIQVIPTLTVVRSVQVVTGLILASGLAFIAYHLVRWCFPRTKGSRPEQ